MTTAPTCRHCRLSEEHPIHTTAHSRHAHPFVADEEEADPANLVPNAIDYVATNLEIIEGLIARLAELAREATVASELVFRMQARLLAARAELTQEMGAADAPPVSQRRKRNRETEPKPAAKKRARKKAAR